MTFKTLKLFLLFTAMVCTSSPRLLAQQVKDVVPVKKAETNIRSTVKDITSTPIDSTHIQREKSNVVKLQNETSDKLKESKAALKKLNNLDVDTSKIKTRVSAEKNGLKNDVQNYKKDLALPKYQDIKIDTGDIPLTKDGLANRGDQFLKTNTNGVKLPESLPKNNFKVIRKPRVFQPTDSIRNAKLNEDELKKQVTAIPKSLEGSKNSKVSKAAHAADSVSKLADQDMFAKGKLQFAGAKKIYSEKALKKAYDSLGLQKADSIYKAATPLIKKEVSKEELLQSINQSFAGKTQLNGKDFDPTAESLDATDANKLTVFSDELSKSDVSKMTLPQDVLSELEPLRGDLVDKKYLKVVDSVRVIKLKAERLKLEENEVTQNLKSAVIKHKPSFFDKSYIDVIIGYAETGKFKIVQLSPSWGYHFTQYFSVGLGPSVLVQAEEKKKLNTVLGFRYYGKVEFLQRKVYVQVEDSMNPAAINNLESVRNEKHSFLAGAGVVLPISKKLALNPCILYRVNTDGKSAGGSSPWVIRVGLSSVKTKK
jgi:hypothetical protein